MPADRLTAGLLETTQQQFEFFKLKLVGECGGADQIAKQHREPPPLLPVERFRAKAGQRRSTLATKRHPWRVHKGTGKAGPQRRLQAHDQFTFEPRPSQLDRWQQSNQRIAYCHLRPQAECANLAHLAAPEKIQLLMHRQ